MRERILEKLEAIESEADVTILFACESGSRAWGFPSPDSDYDVRFVYAHDVFWYLQIGKAKDTIDRMLPDDLDFGGWEVRKALSLFAKCNLPLFEWVGSPIGYISNSSFHTELRRLIPEFFNGRKALHHYFSLAARTAEKELMGNEIGIKKLFYILRPVYACRWILDTHTMPPTHFPEMLGQGFAGTDTEDEIHAILHAKKSACEDAQVTLSSAFLGWLRGEMGEIEKLAGAYPPPETTPSPGALNGLLRDHVFGDLS
jgi:predicted nucleotidyltransferase